MGLLRWCMVAALAMTFIPAVQGNGDFYVIEDRFVDVPVDDLAVAGGCGPASRPEIQGQVIIDADRDLFTFHEGDPVLGSDGIPPELSPDSGGARAVCALVSYGLKIPNGTDHLHVRFDADRQIAQSVTMEYHMPQELRLYNGDGLLESIEVFPWDDGSHDRARFAELGPGLLPFFPMGPTVGDVRVAWYFEDQGVSGGRNQQGVLSGQAFQATVWDPVIEISSAPHAAVVERADRREGTTIYSDTIVPVTYDPGQNQTNLRVRGPLATTFSHVLTQSGERWEDTGILAPGAEYGPDLNFIMLERNSAQGFTQVTLPDSRMASDGGTLFYVVFTETSDAVASPTLMGFNAGLAALPLAFAAMALQRIREFQREAFGGYRRSAKNLMITLVLIFAYYLVAMIGAISAGWFTMASILPPNTEALLLYIQIALAMAAFWWLWLTGREMYSITRPAPRHSR